MFIHPSRRGEAECLYCVTNPKKIERDTRHDSGIPSADATETEAGWTLCLKIHQFPAARSVHAEVDHGGTGLALLISNAPAIAIALRELRQQRQGIVVVGEAHGFTRLQRVQRAKNGRVAKPLGHTARIEG